MKHRAHRVLDRVLPTLAFAAPLALLAACSGVDATLLLSSDADDPAAPAPGSDTAPAADGAATPAAATPAAASTPGSASAPPPPTGATNGSEGGILPVARDPGDSPRRNADTAAGEAPPGGADALAAAPVGGPIAADDDTSGADTSAADGSRTGAATNDGTPSPVTPSPVTPSPVTPGPVAPALSTAGVVLGGACFPLCVAPENLDPSLPGLDPNGFSEEGGARCVIPSGLVGASGRASCSYEGTPTELLPPALDPARQAPRPPGVSSSGFFVRDGQLFDAYGNAFVLRGVNVPNLWFDPPEPLDPGSPFRYQAYDALAPIAALGANSVRIVWQTEGGNPQLLREIIARVVGLGMVPMVELHDLTGGRSGADLLRMAEYYASDDIRSILLDFEAYLLVNIANEWSGNLADYAPAVALLRDRGIHHTLVIDGSGFGQNINSLLQAGPALLAGDPQHNLLFSVHMYESFAARPAITSALSRAADLALPLIVGEFGWVHGGRAIDYEFIMSEAERLGVGFLAWSWKGNTGGDEALDLALDWQGTRLSEYGSVVMRAIDASAQRASIFE